MYGIKGVCAVLSESAVDFRISGLLRDKSNHLFFQLSTTAPVWWWQSSNLAQLKVFPYSRLDLTANRLLFVLHNLLG